MESLNGNLINRQLRTSWM